MGKQYAIKNEKALGSEIKEIVSAIEPALVDHSRAASIIALVSIAILLQEPELDPETLKEILSDVTKRIAFLIDALNGDHDKDTVN